MRLTSNPKVVGSEIAPAESMRALATMTEQPTHEYWADAPEPLHLATLQSAALVGHRQVTDAYLLGMTALRNQRLATHHGALPDVSKPIQSRCQFTGLRITGMGVPADKA